MRSLIAIAKRMAGLTVGDGTSDADMGPLSPGPTATRSRATSTPGVDAGATLVVDGRDAPRRRGGTTDSGWAPRCFDRVTPIDVRLQRRDIRARCSRGAGGDPTTRRCELVNANPYGNGTAIFTNDGGAARRFQNEVEVGMVGINVPIPVPVAYYSFGGWKNSLFGDAHAHGTEGVHFFTNGKVVTTGGSTPATAGINLGFPRND